MSIYENDISDVDAYIQRQQSKWMLEHISSSLIDKFERTEWRPIGWSPALKSYKAGIDRDKNGQHHYRDLESGKFSKSPLAQLQEHNQAGDLILPEINCSLVENLYSKANCYKYDFGRSSIPGIQTGGRAYVCTCLDGNYSVEKDNFNIGGSANLAAGFNLASGEANYSAGSTRLDVDGPRAELSLGAQFASDKDKTDLGAELTVGGYVTTVVGEVKSKKVCFSDSCYTATLAPSAGIGVIASFKAGYHNNKKTNSTSCTLAVAAGLAEVLGATLSIEKEPNIESNKNNSPRVSHS